MFNDISDFMFEYKWVYCYKSMSMECPFSCFREEVNCWCVRCECYGCDSHVTRGCACVYKFELKLKLPCIFDWNAFDIVTALHCQHISVCIQETEKICTTQSKITKSKEFSSCLTPNTMDTVRWKMKNEIYSIEMVKLTALSDTNNECAHKIACA